MSKRRRDTASNAGKRSKRPKPERATPDAPPSSSLSERELEDALRALRGSNDATAAPDDPRERLAAPIGYTRKHGGLPPTRKSLGQNWLVDPGVTRAIASSLLATPDDLILEIGPGAGALTEELLRTGAEVRAVEIDQRMVDVLHERWPDEPRLTVHHADILSSELEALTGGRPCLVVGNLPYNITSSLLFKLMDELRERPGSITRILVLLQLEAARRVAAGPNESEANVLSVLLRAWGEPELLMTVPREVFQPAPKVDAGLLRLDVGPEPRVQIDHWPTFQRLVKGTFSNRRKMLRNTVPSIPNLGPLEGIEFDWTRRPQSLSVNEFAWLANHLVPKRYRDDD